MPYSPNSGVLFVNQYKKTPNQPDRTGNLTIDCPHCHNTTGFRLAGWIKQNEKFGQYLSISARLPEEKPPGNGDTLKQGSWQKAPQRQWGKTRTTTPSPQQDQGFESIGDEIPF